MPVPETILQLQVEGYRAMSPSTKLAIAWGLRQFAWETKAAALRFGNPQLSEVEVRRLVGEWLSNERP